MKKLFEFQGKDMLAKIKNWSSLLKYWWRKKGRNWWEKNRLIVISGALLAIGMSLRLAKLTSVPFFVQEDELVYGLNGRFLWLTGRDLTGTWSPWSLSPIEPWFNELTAPTIALFMGLPWGNLWSVRIMTSLMGLGLIGIIAGLGYELTRSKSVSWWAGAMALFNPWLWQISRTNFDCFFSFFFYALGGWLFLRLKNWQKLWSIFVFFLGFYQYQGYKLILLPWVMILGLFILWPYLKEWWSRKNKPKENPKSSFRILEAKIKRKNRQKVADKSLFLPVLIVVGFSAVLTAFYGCYQLPHQTASFRSSSVLLPDNKIITDKLDKYRLETLPDWSKKILLNQYSVYLTTLGDKYLSLYDPRVLFWELGESGVNTYWVWYAGSFYLIDAFLIGCGLYYLIREKNWQLLTFLGLLLIIAPLPAVLNGFGDGVWWLHRGSFRVLPLLIIASIGLSFIWKKMKKWGRTSFIVVYMGSIVIFASLYFYRLPVTAAVPSQTGSRLVSEYLRRIAIKGQKADIYLANSLETYFRSYLFYNNIPDEKNARELQDHFLKKNYSWQGMNFTSDCFNQKILWSEEELISSPLDKAYLLTPILLCEQNGEYTSVSRDWAKEMAKVSGRRLLALQSVADHSDLLYVWGDQLCGEKDELSGTSREVTLDALNLEKLTDTEFCHYYLAEI